MKTRQYLQLIQPLTCGLWRRAVSSVHRFIGSSVHRFIGSSVHRFIGSSVHRFIGSSVHRFARGVGSRTHRLLHPDSLTPGLEPGIAHGLTGARELSDLLIPVSGLDGQTRPSPISVSGWDGLTRASSLPVTQDVAVTGARSTATTPHILPRSGRTARKQRGQSLTVVRFLLGLEQRLRPMPIPMPPH